MKSFGHEEPGFEAAHKRSIYNRETLLTSDVVGCFQCQQIFAPAEIEDWIDERNGVGMTALCPRCGIDSVLGSRSGYPITAEFLQKMNERWFGSAKKKLGN
jgi:hypothetical protein